MGDLFLALSLFSNINIFKEKSLKTDKKYCLCYMPLVGVIIGIVIGLWYFFAHSIGINRFIIGSGGAVLTVLIVGNRHIGSVIEKFGRYKILAVLFYTVILWALFSLTGIRGVLVSSGVFVLSRVMAVFLFIDCDYIEEGLYKELSLSSRTVVVSIITVVWLMAVVAYIEMINIYYFGVILFTVFAIYFIFAKKRKRNKTLSDRDINSFIVNCEFIIFVEIIVLSFFVK